MSYIVERVNAYGREVWKVKRLGGKLVGERGTDVARCDTSEDAQRIARLLEADEQPKTAGDEASHV